MKIIILHLSDFHLKKESNYNSIKIDKIAQTLNQFSDVSKIIIAFTGDLTNEGYLSQYNTAKKIFYNLIKKIRNKFDMYIDVLIIPGNHDLCFNDRVRDEDQILGYYREKNVDEEYKKELELLDNFYSLEYAKVGSEDEKIVKSKIVKCGKLNIQFNLINSTPFSTLEPKDKQLHYIPQKYIKNIDRKENIDISFSLLHHDVEWFSWEVKDLLEKELYENNEFILLGHDHSEKIRENNYNFTSNTTFSCAGEVDFDNLNNEDSFNIIVLDSLGLKYDFYIEKWNKSSNMYVNKICIKNKKIIQKKGVLFANNEFIKTLLNDNLNLDKDFTKYYTFPKLVHEETTSFSNNEEYKDFESFKKCLEKNKIVYITGSSGCGKTSLLKYLFYVNVGDKVPILLTPNDFKRVNLDTFMKRLFEDQYSNDSIAFEQYKQLEKNKKILLIDDIDRITIKDSKKSILDYVYNEFDSIIVTGNNYENDIEKAVKSELTKETYIYSLTIKPFFAEKRNELVTKLCNNYGITIPEQINTMNKLIDSLVKNNPDIFSLNPGYLIKYIRFFTNDNSFDYTKGEKTFSVIFEHELKEAIINYGGEDYLEDMLISFEEIAGFMYKNKIDNVSSDQIVSILEDYNESHDVDFSFSRVIEVSTRMNLLKQNDLLHYYFTDKNYFSYLIARYLLKIYHHTKDNSLIEYAFNNICFEINEKIVLYILYLTQDYETVMILNDSANSILEKTSCLDLDNINIRFIGRNTNCNVSPPTDNDEKESEKIIEKKEEEDYKNVELEAVGVFDYNEKSINDESHKFRRACIYTEMICKSLSIFFSSMTKGYKDKLIDSFYVLPNKIIYKYLEPLDRNFDIICNTMLDEIKNSDLDSKIKNKVDLNLIQDVFQYYGISNILAIYCHFSEICLNKRTFVALEKRCKNNMAEKIQHLMNYELSGNTNLLVKESEQLLKETNNNVIISMIKLIIKKHIVTNKNLKSSEKQSLKDKFLPNLDKKYLL